MTTPKLLNPDELSATLRRIALTGVAIAEDVTDVRAHIAALELSRDETLRRLEEAEEQAEAWRRRWQQANKDLLAAEDGVVQSEPVCEAFMRPDSGYRCARCGRAREYHPGGRNGPKRMQPGSLAEHTKALVRARNEGLEKAATAAERTVPLRSGCSCPVTIATTIRAMMEPE